MPPNLAEKVHIIPLGLDYDRIVKGIQRYGASKIYIIRGKPHPVEFAVEPYAAKLRKYYADIDNRGRFKEIKIDIFNIGEVCSAIYKIIDDEKENNLFFSISSSTKLLSAYMMVAVWSKSLEMTHEPVIYYVDPSRYIHIEFSELGTAAESLLKNLSFEANQKNNEDIRKFITKIRDLANDAKEGLTIGEADQLPIHEIPFIPVNLPNKIGIRILRILYENKGHVDRIKVLTKQYLIKVMKKTDSEVNDNYSLFNKTRSSLYTNISKLESLKMIKKTKKGRNTGITATDLGIILGQAFETKKT